MPYKNKSDRNYKREYENYDGTEKVKKKRAERNRARRIMEKAGKAHKGDGKDVHHVKALSNGGSHKDGLKVVPASDNRSFARDSDRKLTSEVSPRERKRANNK
jgi:hypothetical protein